MASIKSLRRIHVIPKSVKGATVSEAGRSGSDGGMGSSMKNNNKTGKDT